MDGTVREAGQSRMNRRKEVKSAQRVRVDKPLGGDRSRDKDSDQGDSDSGVFRLGRSRWEKCPRRLFVRNL